MNGYTVILYLQGGDCQASHLARVDGKGQIMESEKIGFFTVPIPKSKVLGTILAIDDYSQEEFGRSFYRKVDEGIGIYFESFDENGQDIDIQMAIIRIEEFDTIPGIFTKLSCELCLGGQFSKAVLSHWNFLGEAIEYFIYRKSAEVKEIIDNVPSFDILNKPILTDAEIDVYDLICKGFSNKEICLQRNVEIKTVKEQKRSIRKKLKINGTGKQVYINKAKEYHLEALIGL